MNERRNEMQEAVFIQVNKCTQSSETAVSRVRGQSPGPGVCDDFMASLLQLMSCPRKTFSSTKASIWRRSRERGAPLCINYLFKRGSDQLLIAFIHRGRRKAEDSAKGRCCSSSSAANQRPALRGCCGPPRGSRQPYLSGSGCQMWSGSLGLRTVVQP